MSFRNALMGTVSYRAMAEAVVWGTFGLRLLQPSIPRALPEDAVVFPTRDDLAL